MPAGPVPAGPVASNGGNTGAGYAYGAGAAGYGGASGAGGAGFGGPGGGPADPGTGGQSSRRRLGPLVGIAAALVVLIGGGGFYYFSTAHKPSTTTAAGKTTNVQKKDNVPAKGPEQVVSVTPADGTTDVNGGAAIKVVFSEPLSATSAMPKLTPAIKGSWHVSGSTATFVPVKGFWQETKVKVTVPAGATGVQSNGGGKLETAVTASFRTGKFSTVRLEQLLAQLDYLPLTWAPTTGTAIPLSSLNAQYSAAYAPPQGSYTWESGYPTSLASLWTPDAPSEVLRGAVAAFQADHDLTSDMILENQEGLVLSGTVGHRLWLAIFKALNSNAMNKHGYTYALASQHTPETLTVWHNGAVIFHHLANTGIPVSPTSPGTNPVYIRYQNQIMRGTNPDGSKYADPVAWVAYFHEGEAVHYFPRYSYGSQQSLGCVELPYKEAKQVWPYLTYGTLVTVTKV